MKVFKPEFWDKNYYTLLSLLLMPISLIYEFLFFLKKITIRPKKFKIPIICIGNIYIGGTGKTPLAIKTYKILKEINKNPVIIKKHYQNHKDEMLLLKNYSRFISSNKRSEGIIEAIEKKYDCVILDDGYQDHEIKKDLNIICFNSNQKLGNGQTLPSGPLRESPKSLKNCEIILVNGKKDLEFENKLKRYNKSLKFFYYTYSAKNLNEFKNKKLVAFAGIGNPENFFELLKLNYLNVVKEIRYPDHYEYTQKELDQLKDLEKEFKGKLITTEKDYFRINPIFRKRVNFLPIKVELTDEQLFVREIKKYIQ
tara:strand:- start:116 stop:1048 length:933 start_codon:yes stop_codon:yes gene_type:complete